MTLPPSRWLFLLLLCIHCTAQAMPEIPSVMLLVGQIKPDEAMGSGSVAPRKGDQVLAFNAGDGTLVGSGPVSDSGQEYATIIGRTASFDGTPVVLELLQGRARYQLSIVGQSTLWFPFRGHLFPARTSFNLQVGKKTADLLADEALNPQAQRLSKRPDVPCDAAGDVNSDGKCDEVDWAVLGLFGGGVTRSVANP